MAAVVVVAAIGGGGFFAYSKLSGNGDKKVVYRTQDVAKGNIRSTVTATGTLSPLNTVQVGSQVSGRIQEILVDFNSVVKKGQVIARIDPSITRSAVAKSRANLQSAYASVTKARATVNETKQRYERTKGLLAKNLVATAELESARAAYLSARATLTSAYAQSAQARADLEQAKVNLGYTTIVSPIDGVVISRAVDVGQTVAASLQAPTLFTIAEDLKAMEVHTSVAESDVGKIRTEMNVEFTVDAFPNERFRGVVKQVRNSPTTVQNVVTYDAVIRVTNDELKLRPGMTANVTFILAERRDVVAIPNTALRFTPPAEIINGLGEEWRFLQRRLSGDSAGRRGRRPRADRRRSGGADAKARRAQRRSRRVVWIADETGRPSPVRVQVGITDGRNTEITGGDLVPGAKLIIGTGAGKAPARSNNRRRRRRGFL